MGSFRRRKNDRVISIRGMGIKLNRATEGKRKGVRIKMKLKMGMARMRGNGLKKEGDVLWWWG